MSSSTRFSTGWLRRTAHEFIVYLIIGFSFFAMSDASAGICNIAYLVAGCLLIAALMIQIHSLTSQEAVEDYPPHIAMALAVAFIFGLYVLFQAVTTGHYPIWRFLFLWIKYCAFAVTLLPIISRAHSLRRMMLVLSGMALFAAMSGLIERFTGILNFAGVGAPGVAHTSFGIFYYENSYGAYAALLLPLSVALMIHRLSHYPSGAKYGRAFAALRFSPSVFTSGALFMALISSVMIIALLFSGARAAILIMIIVYAVVVLWLMPIRFKVLATALAAGLGALVAYMAHNPIIGKTLQSFEWHQLAEAALFRLGNYRSSLHLFLDRFWSGWGMGMFGFASPSRMSSGVDAFYFWDHHKHAHNSFLDLLVEGGLIGFILVFVMLSFLVIPPIIARHHEESNFRRIIRAQAVFALAITGLMFLTDSLLRTPIIVMHFVIQLGILARSSQSYVHRDRDYPELNIRLRSLPPVIMAVGCLLIFCIPILVSNLVFHFKIYQAGHQQISQEQRMSEIARIDRDNPERWSDQAAAYQQMASKTSDPGMRKSLLSHARDAAAKASRLVPYFGPYYYQLGWILHEQNDAAGAIEKFERAVELAPSNVKFKTDLMLVYIYEAKKTASIIRRSQYSLKARKLYELIRFAPAVQTHDIVGLATNAQQRKYLTEFIQLVEKYSSEIAGDQI